MPDPRRWHGRGIRAGAAALLLLTLAGCVGAPTKHASPTPTGATSTGLATWRAALAHRDTTAARWVAIGDSLSEGQGASTRSDRWLDRVTAGLRSAYPVSGGGGGSDYLPAEYAVYGPDSTWADWSTAHTGSSAFVANVPDLGYRAVAMQPGASRTYPFTGTGVDIWWTRYPGTGPFTYSIDGGTPKRVTTEGNPSTGSVTTVSGLSSGRHTVTIGALGEFDLEGFTIHRGTPTTGIAFLDATHSGAAVATFTADESGFLGAMRRADPDLITISLGGNDAKSITAAQLRTQYERFVRALQHLPSKPSVLVIGELEPGPSMLAQAKQPWSQYRPVAKQVADATGAAYVSIADLFPASTGTHRTGISTTDDLHPNDLGQQRIARVVLQAMQRTTG